MGKWEEAASWGAADSASGTGSWSQPHSVWPSGWRREACECSQLLQLVHLTLGSAFPGTRRTLRTKSDVTQICQMWEPAWVTLDGSLRTFSGSSGQGTLAASPAIWGWRHPSPHTRNPQVYKHLSKMTAWFPEMTQCRTQTFWWPLAYNLLKDFTTLGMEDGGKSVNKNLRGSCCEVSVHSAKNQKWDGRV